MRTKPHTSSNGPSWESTNKPYYPMNEPLVRKKRCDKKLSSIKKNISHKVQMINKKSNNRYNKTTTHVQFFNWKVLHLQLTRQLNPFGIAPN